MCGGCDDRVRVVSYHDNNKYTSTSCHFCVGNITQNHTPNHTTPQHSTAQHSTAQHSTAQHSTIQYNRIQPSIVYWTRLSISPSCKMPRNRSKMACSPWGESSSRSCPTSFTKFTAISTLSSVGSEKYCTVQ